MKTGSGIDEIVSWAVSAERIKKGDLTILGGMVEEENASDLLTKIKELGMKWCIWEWAHHMEFTKTEVPVDMDLLERGRVFGESGDFTLRRNGRCFLWSFIGEKGIEWPTKYPGESFWSKNEKTVLRLWDGGDALLWGMRENGNVYTEKRMGFRKLRYPPGLGNYKRVTIKYKEFLDSGRTAFVWWYGLEGKE